MRDPNANPQAPQQPQHGQQTPLTQEQLLAIARWQVAQGFNSPVTDLTSEQTQKLLLDPMMGYNQQQEKQRALEGFDMNQAKSFEAAREATAPISNTGKNMQDLYDLARTNAFEKSQFENDLRFIQSENKAVAAENASKIGVLAEKNKFLEEQVVKLYSQLDAERAAGIERAKAGSIGTITVGDTNRK
jgi:hypothetical protein